MRSFEEFRGYQDGWGGEGEIAPPPWSLDAGEALRVKLPEHLQAIGTATIQCTGPAALEFRRGNDVAIVEFDRPGMALCFTNHGDDWTERGFALPGEEAAIIAALQGWLA